ncbi:MAG: Ig-like domain-containing protein [Pseudomonadota bacterium]
MALAFLLSPLAGLTGTVLELEDLGPRYGFRITRSPVEFVGFGFAMAAVDFNGDGLSDLVVSAPNDSPLGRNLAGSVYVVFGTSQTIPDPFNVATLDGSSGFRILGKSGRAGWSVANAGDINNDGVDDLLVGAPWADPEGIGGAGESFLIFGSALPVPAELDLTNLLGFNGFAMAGASVQDRSGFSVDGAGDLNDDGIDDIVVGAPNAERPVGVFSMRTGVTYVVFGSEDDFPETLSLGSTGTLFGTRGSKLLGSLDGDRFGHSVAAMDDMNGDGRSDLLIAAPNATAENRSGAGRAHVFFGSGALSGEIPISSLDGSNGFAIFGSTESEFLGSSLSGAGDVNGDGLSDLLLHGRATPDTPNSYLLLGDSQSFSSVFRLFQINGLNGSNIPEPPSDNNSLGVERVSIVGDINADGIDDFAIAIPSADLGGVNSAGRIDLVFGRTQALDIVTSVENLGADLGFTIGGGVDLKGVGFVSPAGDFNGDGIDDVLTATPSEDNVFLIYGNAVPEDTLAPQNAMLSSSSEDVTPPGVDLLTVAAARYADNDVFAGVGVIGNGAGMEGQWQYYSESLSWQSIRGDVSDESALVLAADARLRFLPAPEYSGVSPPLVLRFWDGRWAQAGDGFDISDWVDSLGGFANDANRTSVLWTIIPTNDPPTLEADNPPAIYSNAGPQRLAGWATITPGPANESDQNVTVSVTSIFPTSLFDEVPQVTGSGDLTYTPAAGQTGIATFTVVVADDGGVANGGVDRSAPQQYLITLLEDAIFQSGFEPE